MGAYSNIEINELIFKSLEGEISEDENRVLNDFVSKPENVAYYYKSLCLHVALKKRASLLTPKSMEETGHLSLQELAFYEKVAPTVELPKEKPQRELVHNVVYAPREKQKMSKVSKFTLILSAAAMFFLVFLVYMDSKSTPALGQIEESLEAVWSDSHAPLFVGDSLGKNERFLKKGFVKIRMNDGTTAIMEGPVEFRLEQENQLFLLQGKLTAIVPKEAVGFTVRTPSASIVDYGTEFGVVVDKYAVTEAHVQKGKVEMRLGSDPRVFEQSMCLTSSQAGRVTGQDIQRIPIENTRFSYHVPSPFEIRVKDLKPTLYLQVTDDDLDSFQYLAKSQLSNIEINQNLTVVTGPELGVNKTTKALRISGSEKAISIPSYSQALSLLQSQRGFFSMGFWIRLDSMNEQIISSFLVDGMKETDYHRVLLIDKEGKLQHCAYTFQQKLVRRVPVSDPLKPNTWYFIMIVRNGEKIDEKSIYVNGKCVASDIKDKLGTGNVGHFETMQFGGDFDAFKGFSGELAEIIFIPRMLTAKEIESLYQSTLK